jgi:hypothetical protein
MAEGKNAFTEAWLARKGAGCKAASQNYRARIAGKMVGDFVWGSRCFGEACHGDSHHLLRYFTKHPWLIWEKPELIHSCGLLTSATRNIVHMGIKQILEEEVPDEKERRDICLQTFETEDLKILRDFVSKCGKWKHVLWFAENLCPSGVSVVMPRLAEDKRLVFEMCQGSPFYHKNLARNILCCASDAYLLEFLTDEAWRQQGMTRFQYLLSYFCWQPHQLEQMADWVERLPVLMDSIQGEQFAGKRGQLLSVLALRGAE